MGDANRRTLATYNRTAEEYIERSPKVVEGYLRQWIDAIFTDIPTDTNILEIGSGGGRDADYIESELGFTNLLRTDASSTFVKLLRERGHDAMVVNILDGPVGKEVFGVIFADAVLIHFDDEELSSALKNIYDSLQDGGEFYFTTGNPLGDEQKAGWTSYKTGSERFFNRKSEDELTKELARAGFSRTDTVINTDDTGRWFHVATRKVMNHEG